jgi:hypothetical protein
MGLRGEKGKADRISQVIAVNDIAEMPLVQAVVM